MCWIVGPSPWPQLEVVDSVLSHPPCSLSSFCTFLLLQSLRVGFRICIRPLICVRMRACVFVSTTFPVVWVQVLSHWLLEWRRPAPAPLELNRLEVLLPASHYRHTPVFQFSFQRRAVGCDTWKWILLCGWSCKWAKWVQWKWKPVWSVVWTAEGFRPIWCC